MNFYGTLSEIRADLEYLPLLGTKLKPFFFSVCYEKHTWSWLDFRSMESLLVIFQFLLGIVHVAHEEMHS